jgi:hypothetical protein
MSLLSSAYTYRRVTSHRTDATVRPRYRWKDRLRVQVRATAVYTMKIGGENGANRSQA